MGIGSFFSKSGRKSRAVARYGKIIANTKASGDERYGAMIELEKDRSPDAIHAILTRFTYTADVGTRSRVSDEQEKTLAYELIVGIGEDAIGEVHKFLLTEEGGLAKPKHSISYALRILDEISPDFESTWKIIQEVIEANEPGYEKDSSRKLELLTFLGEWHRSKEVAEAILPYLEDADDQVRFQCSEALLGQGDPICKEPLLEILADKHESYQIRNRILSGFIDNAWVEDIDPYIATLDEPGLMQATESLVNLADRELARGTLLMVSENKYASTRIKSRIAEWFVLTGTSVHGMRGRMERWLPKGYKVAKKRVERFPDAMREPYVTHALEDLMERDDPELCTEGIGRLLRNRDIEMKIFVRTIEFLVRKAWPMGQVAKTVKKALPKGYDIGEDGAVVRKIEGMDEPFLTAAGDTLLDHSTADDDDARVQLIEVLINPNSDDRVVQRIFDRFDRMEWSVRGYDREIERRLPKEFKIQSVGHGQDMRIVRVLHRI